MVKARTTPRTAMPPTETHEPFDPKSLERPAPQLLTYYILGSLLSGPFLVLSLPILWFRYQTLRYRFEETGLRLHVGLLFRKETVTAYRRIQDIHVTSNVIQRWLGIASISIQTASGSAMPEIVLEGITQPEMVRDWLYERLRGARWKPGATPEHIADATTSTAQEEVTQLLSEIRDHLATVAARTTKPTEDPS